MTQVQTHTIPPVLESILRSRGIIGEEMREEFFSPKPQLAYDPFLLNDMNAGVDLLLKAIDEGRKIVIYGDYDCDGVTSTALLMKVLGYLTDNLTYYIPSRLDEGYGLHNEAIDKIAEQGGELIVTVDCGSVSAEEVAYAHSLGIQTVVTDHHTVKDVKAPGIVINPKVPDNQYPFDGLAGVGVAYKLALAISRKREIPRSLLTEVLELVAVGTIADVMPLVDENRTIVKYGLRLMRLGCKNKGLRRLMELARIDHESIRATNISFGIAPRINAAGRLGDASLGVRMFLAEDDGEVESCCMALMDANTRRRSLQDEAFDQCKVAAEEELQKGDFLLLEAHDVHEGILGIVAGKLKDHMRRPVVIVSRNGDSYKGTGRSVENVDLFSMLNKYRDRFVRFGGHSAACGFTIEADQIDGLRRDLNRDIAWMSADDPHLFDVTVEADADLSPNEADLELAEAIELLEPCGAENELPVFRFRKVYPTDWKFLKNDTKYAKCSIDSLHGKISCMVFHDALEYAELVDSGQPLDLLGTVEMNVWNNRRSVQIIVSAMMPAQ